MQRGAVRVTNTTIQRINVTSFLTAVVTIVLGVLVGILGIWGILSRDNGLLWKMLGTDATIFAGAVLTNLAIACYRKPGGDVA